MPQRTTWMPRGTIEGGPVGVCQGGQCALLLEQIDPAAVNDLIDNYRVIEVQSLCPRHANFSGRAELHKRRLHEETRLMDAVPRVMEQDLLLSEDRVRPRRSPREGGAGPQDVVAADETERVLRHGVGWTPSGWSPTGQLLVTLHGGDPPGHLRLQAALDAEVGAGRIVVTR